MSKDYSKDEAYAELGRMIIWYKDCGASEETKDNLINLYSKIIDILDKEKEPKRYYLKHKFIGRHSRGHLNHEHPDGVFYVSNADETTSFQTKFTEEEINEIEATGFDLSNYEKVEVEDDWYSN